MTVAQLGALAEQHDAAHTDTPEQGTAADLMALAR